MFQPMTIPLEDCIEWHFHVVEQHNQARYGVLGEAYWKQFMPAGVLISALHSPKKIPKAIYDHAKKIAKA